MARKLQPFIANDKNFSSPKGEGFQPSSDRDTNHMVSIHRNISKPIVYIILFIFLAIISFLLTVQPFSWSQERFIGHADEAATAELARNISEGKGPVVSHVWLLTNGGMPGDSVTHPEAYWSATQAYIMALFFNYFGSNKYTIWGIAFLLRLIIAIVAGYWISIITKNPLTTLAGALFLLLDPAMLNVSNGLFDIYFTFFSFLSLSFLLLSFFNNSRTYMFFSGLLLGVCFCIKVSALIIVLSVLSFLLLTVLLRLRKKTSYPIFLFIAGFMIGILPVLIYNYKYFNIISPFPAAGKLASLAGKLKGITNNHDLAFYDPMTMNSSFVLSWSQWFGITVKSLVKYISGILEGKVVPAWLLPLIIFCWYDLWLTIKLGKAKNDDLLIKWGILSFIIVGAGIGLSIFVHFEARYINFIVPPVVIIAMCALSKLPRVATAAFIVVVLLESIVPHYRFLSWPRVPPSYYKIGNLLQKDTVVLTPDPWEFTFHTRIPSVALPYTDKDDVLISVAKRYHANYLVLIGNNSRHQFYKQLESGINLPSVFIVYRDEDTVIAKIRTD